MVDNKKVSDGTVYSISKSLRVMEFWIKQTWP